MLSAIIHAVAVPLGALMRVLYEWIGDYGVTILLFTLCTKLILFPVSLLVQDNAIRLLRLRPRLDALRFQYADDKDRFLDEQIALYKQEKYRPLAGLLPLCFQLPLILGLINVVYRPLDHILRLGTPLIEGLTDCARQASGETLAAAPQLRVLELVQSGAYDPAFSAFAAAHEAGGAPAAIEAIRGLSMRFLGLNLAATPQLSHPSALLAVPLLAGLSAYVLCVFQNKVNVLQAEQDKLSQWGMTAFLIAFSTYFAFVVPAGVGLYWIAGNLLSIPFLYLVNAVYDPKKHIDYQYLDAMKRLTAEKEAKEKKHAARGRADYKRFCRDENQESMELMFYSEAGGFYKYFQNIIESLLARSDIVIHYVTSDPDDAVFTLNNPRVLPYYVGEKRLIPLMMRVEADVVVMTVPDLEKYHIKRSRVRKDVEYIFVDHGGTSLNLTYRTGAFDYFDTIFAVNQRQADEVRAIEKLRRTKKKTVVNCGYGLLDNMIAAYGAMEKTENAVRTILIAPSWQDGNILEGCIDALLDGLLGRGSRVIVRPHPQYIRRFPINMDALIQRYRGRFDENFEIQTDFSSNATVYTADLVITDWSAIGVEFALTTKKPALFVNTPMKVVNPDWQKIPVQPFIIDVRTRAGRAVDIADLGRVGEIADELIANGGAYREGIERLLDEFLFNPGHSGEVGADYIIGQIEKKRGRVCRKG